MRDSYIQAKLIRPDAIRLVVFSALPFERLEPVLLIDDVKSGVLHPSITQTMPQLASLEYTLPRPLELGHSYFLVFPQFGAIPLDVSEATEFPNFESDFYYAGDDLGFTYSKKETRFALWAPLASKCSLLYRKRGAENWLLQVMERTE